MVHHHCRKKTLFGGFPFQLSQKCDIYTQNCFGSLEVATAPVVYQTKMATERAKWWQAFLPKKKTTGSKDHASTRTIGPDFDPFANGPEKQKEPTAVPSKNPDDKSPIYQQEPNKSPSLPSDETDDSPELDSVFNEQTCRRNMKVSRSGRWKEKKKVRSSLPIQEKETECVATGKEDIR